MSPSEIAFLAAGLIIGAAIGAAVAEALRARPAPRRQVRLTISPNSVSPRRSATLADPAAAAGHAAVPGSPADGALHDGSGDGPATRIDPARPAPPPGLPNRTAVPSAPSAPVTMPAGAIAVPVAPEGGVPVGPGQATTVRRADDGTAAVPRDGGGQGAGPSTGMVARPGTATLRPSAIAVAADDAAPERAARAAIGVLEPVRTAAAPPIASVDVGAAAPGIAVRARPPVETPRPALGPLAVAVPIVARLGRGEGEPVGGPMAMSSTSADPCDVPRRLVEERCELASTARERAKAAAEALREARRAYDTLREHVERAEHAADPREIAAAKDELHRRFRAASDLAPGAEAAEAAAREWLAAINDLNTRARDAARFLEKARADLSAAMPRLDRLALEADAARISAETAEVACRDARERLAACEEAQANAPVPAAAGAGDEEPHPFDEVWPGESESTRTQPMGSPAAAAMEGPLPVVVLLLRGDRDALERLVAQLAQGDAEAARTWRLRLSALVDAINARAIEDGYLDLPGDDPFWGLFTYAERRDIVGALSALGYRFDGLGGFADGRVPAARDLSLAVGYAGLDRMRIRTWPRESDTGALFERATVAADLWLAERADDLSLGQMVDALGSRAADLADTWNAWGRLRPALLADA